MERTDSTNVVPPGRLEHRLAKNYISAYADGILISAGIGTDMTTLTFFSDAISIESEELEFRGEHEFRVKVTGAKTKLFREDVASIKLSASGARSLYEALRMRFADEQK